MIDGLQVPDRSVTECIKQITRVTVGVLAAEMRAFNTQLLISTSAPGAVHR